MQRSLTRSSGYGPARQQGVIVFIALIVLVAMTLAALSLIRSTDTGNLIAGNVAFKTATANASDQGVEAAYRVLIVAAALGGTTLNNDNAFAGYYSSNPGTEPNYFDSTWFAANGQCLPAGCAPDANGNVTYYVVHRMCTQRNAPYNGNGATGQPNQCATLTSTGNSSTGGGMGVGSYQYQTTPQLYYRITALVVGPRNTQAAVQVMVVI